MATNTLHLIFETRYLSHQPTLNKNNLKVETKVEPPQTARLLTSQVIILNFMALHPDLEALMESSHRKL